jgi:hypothetical protein
MTELGGLEVKGKPDLPASRLEKFESFKFFSLVKSAGCRNEFRRASQGIPIMLWSGHEYFG